jgi:hypothetical protein
VSLHAIAVLAFIALLESAQRASMGHTKLKLAMASTKNKVNFSCSLKI